MKIAMEFEQRKWLLELVITIRLHMVHVLAQPQCTYPGSAYWMLHVHDLVQFTRRSAVPGIE